MIYKNFQDIKLSALGLGCMRLPVIDGQDAQIDTEKTQAMIDYAMEKGINYYDTAWGYHSGNSETVVGAALAKYPRESYYLATKFPGYDVNNFGKVEEIFGRQLDKCQVEYFDFYLMHNICEVNVEQYLDDETYGTFSYLNEQRKQGRIRHLGFSAHAELPALKKFLEKYGKDMEFCQLQINYFDWKFQDAEAKVKLLQEYNIPVWVMEPLRGGRLAQLTENQSAKLKAIRPDESIPAWALRFLQTIPVTMTLTGSSSFEQLKENIGTFEEAKPLTEEEMSGLMEVVDDMLKSKAVPCTACRYCTTHCPQGLDIPGLLAKYNQMRFTGDWDFVSRMALAGEPADKQPSACIGCGSCQAVCPQSIAIPEALADFAKRLGQ